MGVILEQPDELHHFHPVTYYSKALGPAERNYVIHDKELLAIVTALTHFQHYLEGMPHATDIWTDHNNLRYFMTKQKLSRQQAWWALFLSRFDFTITHHPGMHNKSDALSQCPDHKEGMEHDNEKILLNPKSFAIRATRPRAVTSVGDKDLWHHLKDSQDRD